MEALWHFLDATMGLSATKAEELTAAEVCVRAAVVYLLLIGYARFGKKRFLGRATAFDAILVIVIGSIASRAISGTAPFFASLAGTLVLVLVHWIISYFTEDSTTLSNFLKGRDTVLVKNGRVNRKALRDEHMSPDDLAEDLRQEGVRGPSEVKEARLERSGLGYQKIVSIAIECCCAADILHIAVWNVFAVLRISQSDSLMNDGRIFGPRDSGFCGPATAVFVAFSHHHKERNMKAKVLLATAVVLTFAAPAVADEYYVVRGPDRHCTVTTTRPTEQTTVTQIGPLAFETREKAQDRIKTTKVCSDDTTTGTSVHIDKD